MSGFGLVDRLPLHNICRDMIQMRSGVSLMTVWILLTGLLDASLLDTGDHRDLNSVNDADMLSAVLNRSHREISRKVVVTTTLEPPYMMFKQQSMGSFLVGNDRFEGYMADMINHLAVTIGFEYDIRLSLDGTYGQPDATGNWNGMIGQLQRGEADIAVGPLTKTEERETVVDFTEPFMTFRSTAVLKIPSRASSEQHGYTHERLETAEQLMQSDVTYGVINSGLTESLIRTSDSTLYRNMWSRMLNFWPPAFVQNTEAGVGKARKENYAFILDTPMAEYKMGQEPCDLYSIEPFLPRRSYGLAMRKGDRLISVINSEIRSMRRNQILQSLYLKWWASSCAPHQDSLGDGTGQHPDPQSSSPRPARGHSTAGFRSSGHSIHHDSWIHFHKAVFISTLGIVILCRFTQKLLLTIHT